MGSYVPPRKNYLITYPRSASNLLVKILALQDQPDILSIEKLGGYYFLPLQKLVYADKDVCGVDPQKWTPEQKQEIINCYKQCFEHFRDYLNQAESASKGVFVKEHSNFFINPIEQAKWITNAADAEPWSIDHDHYPLGAETIKQQTPNADTDTDSIDDDDPSRPPFHHSANNMTIFSDEFLLEFQPTCLIRHPAMMFPSLMRSEIDFSGHESAVHGSWTKQNELICTLRWTRSLYDWYADRLSKMANPPRSASLDESAVTWPIVLDADDFISDPDTLKRYCHIVGLDETKLKFEWNHATTEEKNEFPPIGQRMLSTIHASTGIMKSKLSVGIDIDKEAKKWHEEFGQELGHKVEKWVRDAMPDYEYLRARRLMPQKG